MYVYVFFVSYKKYPNTLNLEPFLGFDGGSLTSILNDMQVAEDMFLDRWHIEFSTTSTDEQGDPVPYNIINNYFSIGVVSWHFFILLIKMASYSIT